MRVVTDDEWKAAQPLSEKVARGSRRIGGLKRTIVRTGDHGKNESAARKKKRGALYLKVGEGGQTPGADNLLANLSHELRTPLTPALLIISALQSNPDLSEEVRSDLAIVREQVELEVRLVDALLDMAELDQGELRLQLEMADMRAILHGVAAAGRAVAARGPGIQLEYGATRSLVRGDAARLTQIFANLMHNAIKFTPADGSIRIVAEDEGDRLVVSVIDTGRGIKAGALSRIFAAFEQDKNPLNEGRGGLGVGLSVAKGLVVLHGGELTAHSEGEGRGATFRVKLPTMKSASESEGSAGGRARKRNGRTLRVLLVEDHGQSLLATARLIRHMGHSVRTAVSLATATALLHAEPFDLLVADLELPDGTGWDLMRAARKIGPVAGIALSGHGEGEDIAKSLAAGFTQHLVKPITVERLTGAMEEVVAGVEAR
jgi:CheY-like chemotaxis protein